MDKQAGVAQLVEHLICNQRVGGSTPSASSTDSVVRPGHIGNTSFLRHPLTNFESFCPSFHYFLQWGG